MFKVFKFTSKNTGHYFAQDLTLKQARDKATFFKHTRIEGDKKHNQSFWEEYKDGNLIAQSI